MADTSKDKTDPKDAAGATAQTVDFTVSGVLARLRGTLTGWVTALGGIAAAVFGGLSLGEYVKAPADANPVAAGQAQLCMALLVIGVILLLGASGLGAAMRAPPQDGAFKARTRDPLRFFPRNTAPELLQEYKDEVARFNAARLRDDVPGMNEATYWMTAHAQRLWQWLDVYRAREAGRSFQTAAWIIAVGAVLAGAGTIGFADALRRMKSTLPENVIVQGPKDGTLTLLAAGIANQDLKGLYACTIPGTDKVPAVPVTVMKVSVPSAEEKDAAWNYRAEVVPPLIDKEGCLVKVYTVDNTQATVAIAVEAPVTVTAEAEKKAESSTATSAAKETP